MYTKIAPPIPFTQGFINDLKKIGTSHLSTLVIDNFNQNIDIFKHLPQLLDNSQGNEIFRSCRRDNELYGEG